MNKAKVKKSLNKKNEEENLKNAVDADKIIGIEKKTESLTGEQPLEKNAPVKNFSEKKIRSKKNIKTKIEDYEKRIKELNIEDYEKRIKELNRKLKKI